MLVISFYYRLGIAMLQVAQGVNFDAWKEPFALEDKKRGIIVVCVFIRYRILDWKLPRSTPFDPLCELAEKRERV